MFLGIDPGVRKLGYALIKDDLSIIDAGIVLINEKNLDREKYFQRMLEINNFFEEFLWKYKIKAIWMEKLFFTKFNQANAEFVFGMRWNVIIQALKNNIEILEFTPTELKKNITGNWKAEKILVQNFVMKIYWLKNMPQYNDSADALGLAFLAKRLYKE